MSLIESWNLASLLRRATSESPFIANLSAGILPQANFNTWLYNDYLFARCWAYSIARIITSLPEEPSTYLDNLREILVGGFKVAQQELEVFKSRAAYCSVKLPYISPVSSSYQEEALKDAEEIYNELSNPALGVHEGCKRYIRWMSGDFIHADCHWTTRVAAFWMLEKVYCDAMWTVRAGPGFAKLDEITRHFIRWWAKEEFKDYVQKLEEATLVAKGGGWGWEEDKARTAAQKVLELEVEFWATAEVGL